MDQRQLLSYFTGALVSAAVFGSWDFIVKVLLIVAAALALAAIRAGGSNGS